MSTLGLRIKQARESNELLQSDLAKLIGVKSAGVISNWEKDLSKPDANKLVNLCKALNVSASYLLDYYGDNNFEILPHEREYIKKYRKLDTHGKELVNLLIEKELQRCAAADPSDVADEVLAEINSVKKKLPMQVRNIKARPMFYLM